MSCQQYFGTIKEKGEKMKVNRAYKLNKEKQPAEEKGKFLYYF